MEIKISVSSPQGEFVFSGDICRSEDADGRFLGEEFYKKTGGILQGVHHEIKLVSIPESPVPLHIESGKVLGEKFVCYPPQLPSVESAIEIFKVWCVGSTYSILHKKDFGPEYDKVKNNEKFLTQMAEEYGFSAKIV